MRFPPSAKRRASDPGPPGACPADRAKRDRSLSAPSMFAGSGPWGRVPREGGDPGATCAVRAQSTCATSASVLGAPGSPPSRGTRTDVRFQNADRPYGSDFAENFPPVWHLRPRHFLGKFHKMKNLRVLDPAPSKAEILHLSPPHGGQSRCSTARGRVWSSVDEPVVKAGPWSQPSAGMIRAPWVERPKPARR